MGGEARHIDHPVRPGAGAQAELRLGADGPAETRIGEAQALGIAIGGDREAPGLRIALRHDGESCGHPVEIGAAAADARRVEGAAHGRRRERALQAAVEDELGDLGFTRLRHLALGGEGAGLKGQVGDAVGGDAA